MGVENIGIAGCPEENKVSAKHKDQHFNNCIYRGVKVHVSFFFYRKEKCKLDSGNEIKYSVNREAVSHICDHGLVVNGSVNDKHHRCLEKDGKKQHDPKCVRILDPVENAVDKRECDIQEKDGGQIPCNTI